MTKQRTPTALEARRKQAASDRVQAVRDFHAQEPWPILSSQAYDEARTGAAEAAYRRQQHITRRRRAVAQVPA